MATNYLLFRPLDLDDNNNSGAADPDNQTTFAQGSGGVGIADSNNTLITDGDDTNIESATVTLTNAQDGDELLINGSVAGATGSFTSTNNNVINYTTTTNGGEIVIEFDSATANTVPLADYQELIEAITFNNTDSIPNRSDRIIDVTVNDGTSNSNVATTTIQWDTDGDGVADANDIDDDNDGIFDIVEGNNLVPSASASTQPDALFWSQKV